MTLYALLLRTKRHQSIRYSIGSKRRLAPRHRALRGSAGSEIPPFRDAFLQSGATICKRLFGWYNHAKCRDSCSFRARVQGSLITSRSQVRILSPPILKGVVIGVRSQLLFCALYGNSLDLTIYRIRYRLGLRVERTPDGQGSARGSESTDSQAARLATRRNQDAAIYPRRTAGNGDAASIPAGGGNN